MLVCLMLSHKSLRYPCLFHSFFFLLLGLGESTTLCLNWLFLLLYPVCCWTPLVFFFSVWLLYSLALWLLVLSYVLHLFVDILAVFIYYFPLFLRIFMIITFNSLSGKLFISISLSFILYFHLKHILLFDLLCWFLYSRWNNHLFQSWKSSLM